MEIIILPWCRNFLCCKVSLTFGIYIKRKGVLLWLRNYGRFAKNVAVKKMRMRKNFAIRANKKGVNIGVISKK